VAGQFPLPAADELLVTVLALYCLLPPADAVSWPMGTVVLAWAFYVPSKFELLLCAFRLHICGRVLLAGRPLRRVVSRVGLLGFLYALRRPAMLGFLCT
jgi:hypothetical protein